MVPFKELTLVMKTSMLSVSIQLAWFPEIEMQLHWSDKK